MRKAELEEIHGHNWTSQTKLLIKILSEDPYNLSHCGALSKQNSSLVLSEDR